MMRGLKPISSEGTHEEVLESYRALATPSDRLLARNWHVICRRVRDADDDPLAVEGVMESPRVCAPAPPVPFSMPAASVLVSLAVGGSAAMITGIGWSLARLLATS